MQEVLQRSPGGCWQRCGVDGQFVQPLPREPWEFRAVLHEHGMQSSRKGSGRAWGAAQQPQAASEMGGLILGLMYLGWFCSAVLSHLACPGAPLPSSPSAGAGSGWRSCSEETPGCSRGAQMQGLSVPCSPSLGLDTPKYGEILCWWRAKAALCLCVMLRWHPWLFRCDSPGDGKVKPEGWKGAARGSLESSSAVVVGCCGKARAPGPSLQSAGGAIPGRSAHPLPAKPTAALPGGYQSAQIR